MIFVQRDITNEMFGVILHGCNAQKIMGGGVAGAIKKRWPKVYISYLEFFDSHADIKKKDLLGRINVVYISNILTIVNGITQEYYGNDGKKYADIKAIDKVLAQAFSYAYMCRLPLKTVQIGCGLGGLVWETEVKPLFEKYESIFETEAQIFYI